MIKRYNNLSFLFFLPGIAAQIAGLLLNANLQPPHPLSLLALLLIIGGTIMAFIGFGYYAMAKGRSMVWGLAAFFGLPGLLVLAILKDKSGDPWNT
jgi:hypothetical protein